MRTPTWRGSANPRLVSSQPRSGSPAQTSSPHKASYRFTLRNRIIHETINPPTISTSGGAPLRCSAIRASNNITSRGLTLETGVLVLEKSRLTGLIFSNATTNSNSILTRARTSVRLTGNFIERVARMVAILGAQDGAFL